MRTPVRLMLFLGCAGMATPALASDFTPLRFVFLGAYATVSLLLFGLVWLSTRSAGAETRARLLALAAAVLFTPTLVPGPNFFWPAASILGMLYMGGGGETWGVYVGWPTLLAFILVVGAVWMVVRRRGGQKGGDGAR